MFFIFITLLHKYRHFFVGVQNFSTKLFEFLKIKFKQFLILTNDSIIFEAAYDATT